MIPAMSSILYDPVGSSRLRSSTSALIRGRLFLSALRVVLKSALVRVGQSGCRPKVDSILGSRRTNIRRTKPQATFEIGKTKSRSTGIPSHREDKQKKRRVDPETKRLTGEDITSTVHEKLQSIPNPPISSYPSTSSPCAFSTASQYEQFPPFVRPPHLSVELSGISTSGVYYGADRRAFLSPTFFVFSGLLRRTIEAA